MNNRVALFLSAALWCVLFIGAPARAATVYTNLLWSDEFNGPTIDRSNWTFDIGGGGWGNNELEFYTDRTENARIENGLLVIEARKEKYRNRSYTSARLKTQGLRNFKYGRIESRMKITYGQGLWPAFWMLGSNVTTVGWPGCGEVDIMENIGREPAIVHGTLHGPGYSGANGVGGAYTLSQGAFADNFHVFAIEWYPDHIDWFVDNTRYLTKSSTSLPGPWVFDHPFFILLNVAVGGSWPGNPDARTVFPQFLYVDYVRVYQ
jgi:beta-glucanase (GH16 family)